MSALTNFTRRLVSEARLRRRAVILVVTLSLSFVPMVGTLGYFSSLLLAPLLSLLAIGAGVDSARAYAAVPAAPSGSGVFPSASGSFARGASAETGSFARGANASDTGVWARRGGRPRSVPDTLWRLALDGAKELAWLLGIALALLLVSATWNRNCDLLGGLVFFALGPALSAVLGWICGVWGAVIGRARWSQVALGTVPFLFCMAIGLWRLYTEPVVFAFDPFWGWFSGPIYDEGIGIEGRYVGFRAYNLFVATAAWLALRVLVDPGLNINRTGVSASLRGPVAGPNRLRALLAISLFSLTTTLGLSAPTLGWTATTESLSRTLAATYETDHFVIHYAPNSPTAREIETVAIEHEFAWQRLEQRLGDTPHAHGGKVHSFIFKDGKQRRKLLGAESVEVSLPWKGQMYLSHRTFPHSALHHELAHAFLGDFGDPVLGIPLRWTSLRLNAALLEGVPSALDPRPWDHLHLHDQAAILDRLDKRPPLPAIMSVGFWGKGSSRAYTAAGSFTLWLAEQHGWQLVAELYNNAGDFETTFGSSLVDLEARWLEFLRARELREQDVEAQRQRYQRGSVFRRPCAHRVAELSAVIARDRLRGKVDQAVDGQRSLCELEPERPEHALILARLLVAAGELDEATATLDEVAARDQLTVVLRATIERQRGDLALVAGDHDLAGDRYNAALEFGMTESSRRLLQIELEAVDDPDIAGPMIDYLRLFQPEDNSAAAAVRRLWAAKEIADTRGHRALGSYLVGRQLLGVALAPEQAGEALEAALSPGFGEPGLPSEELIREARLSLLTAYLRTRRWGKAHALLDSLERDALGAGHMTTYTLWRERLEFFEAWYKTTPKPATSDE